MLSGIHLQQYVLKEKYFFKFCWKSVAILSSIIGCNRLVVMVSTNQPVFDYFTGVCKWLPGSTQLNSIMRILDLINTTSDNEQ